MRVLFVEDSERLRRSIAMGLRANGYAVDVADSGPSGLWSAQTNNYDVIVLDLMLPGMDGLTLLRKLREDGRESHVLILSAKDTVEDRVTGLRQGADDYLVKPFAFEELLARIDSLSRRHAGVKNPIIRVGRLEIDLAARTVKADGQDLDLKRREYALLELFVLNREKVLSREEIEAHLYDERTELMSNVVDATVYALRRRIDRPGEASMIQTRRGMGYIFLAHPSSS